MNQLRKRTNQIWTESLRGHLGEDNQASAYQDLANYLYVVLYHEIRRRSNQGFLPPQLDGRACEFLAEDIVQEFMLRLVADDFALLKKFSGLGGFTSWTAQVARNMLFSELRRSCWKRQEPFPESDNIHTGGNKPEFLALQGQTAATIKYCLELLPQRSRVALIRCSLEGEKAATVATDLGITANAVNILVHRAKKRMRQYLEAEGIFSSEPLLYADG